MTPAFRLGLRATVSIALLAAVVLVVDTERMLAHLQALDPRWIMIALALSVVQVALSAWRWRFTAARLGLALPMAHAFREYYLGTFLNQILPGGVLGDASRALRHGRDSGRGGGALAAVAIERGSGQVVMALVAVPALVTLLTPVAPALVWACAAAVALALLAGTQLLPTEATGTGPLASLRRALLAPDAFPAQLLSSSAVVATYLGVFLAAARGLGIELPAAVLLPLVPPILLAMLVPITVAGWGLREGAAAAVWATAGLEPAQGAAAAVAYGLLVLLGSLPGALGLMGGPPGRHLQSKT